MEAIRCTSRSTSTRRRWPSFFMTHDLISLPVVDHQLRLVGRITADDVMDVLEEEATEDYLPPGRRERGRVRRAVAAAGGALAPALAAGRPGRRRSARCWCCSHFEQSLDTMVALAFYIPVIMAMAGNVGIQTSSVVVRGLATGEVAFYRIGRHLLRETGHLPGDRRGGGRQPGRGLAAWSAATSTCRRCWAWPCCWWSCSPRMVGTGMPLLLHRLGVDPAVATGPFITTATTSSGWLSTWAWPR